MSQTIPHWLSQRAVLTPNRTALILGNEKYSFLNLHEMVCVTARRLIELGIKESDHVGLLFFNGLPLIQTILALSYIGAVAVSLNTRLTIDELAWQLGDAQAKWFIYGSDFVDYASQINGQVTEVVCFAWEQVESGHPTSLISLKSHLLLDEKQGIMYTSGTTGKPRGVIHTYGNHWWSAMGSMIHLGVQADDRWLVCVPIFHISGLSIIMRCVIYGMCMVILPSFDPEKVNSTIKEEKITLISVVPSMLRSMLDTIHDKNPFPLLRCLLLGGGPASQDLLEWSKDKKIPVSPTYGMTETCSQIVTIFPDEVVKKKGSVGKVLFPFEVKIQIDGKEAGFLKAGEIIVKGANVSPGYSNQTDPKMTISGWFHTGDIGYLDEEGYLYVLDRRNDLIISGGENVYPAEVEQVLLSYPGVKEAGVTGVPHPHWGQVPIGLVVLECHLHEKEEELISFCQKHLAKYKVPSHIYFVDALPKSATHKILRHKLKSLIPGNDIR